MKHIVIFLLTTFCTSPQIVFAQKLKEPRYGYYGLQIDGTSIVKSKQAVLKLLGKPLKDFAAHNECGFFADGNGATYYSLKYKFVDWIGNKKDGYQLENLFMEDNPKFVMTYKGKKISAKTTPKEFMGLSGMHNIRTNTGGENPEDLIKFIGEPKLKTISIDLINPKADDKYIFYFYKGKLCKIEYWSPC